MSAPFLIDTEQLIHNLRLLCNQPSTSGQCHELDPTARMVADAIYHTGLDVKVVRTGNAPIVIGWRAGRLPFTLLLYHHYDLTPTGPWRLWQHDPFQVAERDNNVYGRGVAHGKGPLVAHLQALRTVLDTEGELPHGVVVIVEGERLSGSIGLDSVMRRYANRFHVDACLSTGGERDATGSPFCYSGSKGLLQVHVSARGAAFPLAPGLATSVSNPAWRVAWVLAEIKGADEDIRITGFYDNVAGPNRKERSTLRQARLDETGRLSSWGLPEFLFGTSGTALLRTEVTLPTCNLASFTVEQSNDLSSIPTAASAQLDFQLVPDQTPDEVFSLLEHYLKDKGFGDIMVDRLPGSYAPAQCSVEHEFLQTLVQAGANIYGEPLTVLPFGPFAQPLHIFANRLNIPLAVVGFARHSSAEYGANEHIPIDDLVRHGQLLIEFMVAGREQVRAVSAGKAVST